VKAHIHTIGGFSAHADQAELAAWHKPARARRTFLVHGEERAMMKLAPLLNPSAVLMPRKGERVAL
jgi:metallo-beta-lactamase family protein